MRPAIRYHGSKWRLVPWLLKYFPPHRYYSEPFGGSAAVLLQKPRAFAEVYNDLDGAVVNFFQVLRDPAARAELVRLLRLTPFSRAEFELAWAEAAEPVEAARRLAIRAQMGFGSAGAVKGTTGFRTDFDRNAPRDWVGYPSGLDAIAERLQGVLIENLPALEVLRRYDDADTLHYVDPPYLHATRVMRAKGGYRHEMTDADHVALLAELDALQGMVVLSGYPNELYDRHLGTRWTHATTRSRISAGRGTTLRTERVWLNTAASSALARGGLF